MENLDRIDAVLEGEHPDAAVFPELFLSGYRSGDAFAQLAIRPGDPVVERLTEIAHRRGTTIITGAPVASPERAGEVHNAALLVPPEGPLLWQIKRYLPTFGPFEEGLFFSPTDHSYPLEVGPLRYGLAICYDVFFPEVFRALALGGAQLLVVISASPVTSKRLFERLLPARAIENGLPVVYVNRVGVEDGVVFGGGSGAWSVRGEPLELERRTPAKAEDEEATFLVEIDLGEAKRYRPFRPVLRDVAARPPAAG
jgi:predicted amidohydrolase